MTKNEIIEAINATIIPNGQKGITAESLANLLIEMVNATPEGGSGSSGQVVFYLGLPNEEFTEFTLTPEEMAHNAAMVKVVKESPIALTASVDMTRYMAALAQEGIDTAGTKFNFSANTCIYVTEEYSQIMGLGTELVSIEIIEMGGFNFISDGSVMIMES